ncbi:Protein lin-28 like protein B [Chelonia mydas]|uniref:Protein lin-28 like protein B n=1 Tax=Chelonia mydas TaxID=8469 RepID=M7AW78_CHEMY|nr:Protein lin-28 like protein B [Chelonia mydas]
MAEAGASKGGDEPGKLPEQEEEESQVLHGTGHCKWFNVRMGFGFISMINREGNPLESPVDVFVHQEGRMSEEICAMIPKWNDTLHPTHIHPVDGRSLPLQWEML